MGSRTPSSFYLIGCAVFFLLLLGQRNWQTQEEEEATGALQAGIPPLLTSGDHLPTLILSRPVKIEIAIVYEL